MGGTFGAWGNVLSTLASAPSDLKRARNAALLQEAEFFRTKIVEGLREQAPGGKAFKPLSPRTIAMRKFLGFKGTKALMKRGDLRNSIEVHQTHDQQGSVFTGVLRNAKAADGHSLVDVARLNEYGSKPIVIKLTPKMAALLHAAFRAAGLPQHERRNSTGVVVVQIPPRPFIGPVFEKYGGAEMAAERFAGRVQKAMKGKGVWSAVGKGAL